MNRDSERAAVREAAHTLPGCHESPLESLVNNSVQQLVDEHSNLIDNDLEVVGLVKAAVRRGMALGSTRIGDLL